MAKPKRNWIQEERRKTLGDWVAFCLGAGTRSATSSRARVSCPRRVRSAEASFGTAVPSCAAPIPSAFAVECEECGAEVRRPELFGTAIRKPGR